MLTRTLPHRHVCRAAMLTPRTCLALAVVACFVTAGCHSSSTGRGASRSASVNLTPVPVGTARLTVNSRDLTVQLNVTGFTIRSKHGIVLQSGSCESPRTRIASFPDLKVNAYGAAGTTLRTTATLSVPASASLVITLAPATRPASSASETPLACVDVPDTHHPAALRVLGLPGSGPSATVTLTYTALHTLDVRVTAHGLSPGSAHAVHVHFGSCKQQSGVLYTVGDVTADATGSVDATNTVTGVGAPPPMQGWYVDLHNAPIAGLIDAGQPTLGFQPVLCGDGHF